MPGFLVLHYLPKFAQIHVHLSQWCFLTSSSSAAHFSLCLQSFPASESFLMSQLLKYWSFIFSISPSNEYSGLISFKDWFDLLAVQGTLKSLLQHHSSKASVVQCSAFFMVQLSHPYMKNATGKTIAFDSTGLCWVCNEVSIKTQKGGVHRASGLVNTQRCWEGGRLGEGTGGLCPFPLTLPLASLPPGCSWDVPFYNKSAIEDVTAFLSSVSCSS